MTGGLVIFKGFAQFVAIHFWHHDVTDNDIRDDFFRLLATFLDSATAQRLETIARDRSAFDIKREFAEAGVTVDVDWKEPQPNLRANLKGTTIQGIDTSGLATRLGLRDGDRLKSVNGEACASAADVYAAWSKPLDGRMRFSYERGGESIDVDVALSPSPVVKVPAGEWF